MQFEHEVLRRIFGFDAREKKIVTRCSTLYVTSNPYTSFIWGRIRTSGGLL
jgi:hypothetical protein